MKQRAQSMCGSMERSASINPGDIAVDPDTDVEENGLAEAEAAVPVTVADGITSPGVEGWEGRWDPG